MKVYQYKITAVIDDTTTMIVNLFTSKDMDNVIEREEYMFQLTYIVLQEFLDRSLLPL